jgi:hypothetical protein
VSRPSAGSVFTSTAAGAIEWGALPYARGVIDNQFRYYVRSNGGVSYRAEETPLSARMLTLLAQYYSTTQDHALLLTHFDKAKALGEWLVNRQKISLAYPADDPRHGIPAGNDEGDTYIGTMYANSEEWLHYYASAAECHRAFMEMGEVWTESEHDASANSGPLHMLDRAAQVARVRLTDGGQLARSSSARMSPHTEKRCSPSRPHSKEICKLHSTERRRQQATRMHLVVCRPRRICARSSIQTRRPSSAIRVAPSGRMPR